MERCCRNDSQMNIDEPECFSQRLKHLMFELVTFWVFLQCDLNVSTSANRIPKVSLFWTRVIIAQSCVTV